MRLTEVARLAPLRPGVEPIRIIQDKTLQKAWLAENGFPVGPFRMVRSEAELHRRRARLAGSVFLKIGRGGYDGRGPGAHRHGCACSNRQIVADAWTSIGEKPSVAEQALDLEMRDQRDGGAQSFGRSAHLSRRAQSS